MKYRATPKAVNIRHLRPILRPTKLYNQKLREKDTSPIRTKKFKAYERRDDLKEQANDIKEILGEKYFNELVDKTLIKSIGTPHFNECYLMHTEIKNSLKKYKENKGFTKLYFMLDRYICDCFDANERRKKTNQTIETCEPNKASQPKIIYIKIQKKHKKQAPTLQKNNREINPEIKAFLDKYLQENPHLKPENKKDNATVKIYISRYTPPNQNKQKKTNISLLIPHSKRKNKKRSSKIESVYKAWKKKNKK